MTRSSLLLLLALAARPAAGIELEAPPEYAQTAPSARLEIPALPAGSLTRGAVELTAPSAVIQDLTASAAVPQSSRGEARANAAASERPFERLARNSYQRVLLEMTFAEAARGRNDSMRFGSVLLDPESKEVLGASANRRSRDGETKGYKQQDWAGRLSSFAKSLVAQGKITPGHISLSNSVHAEQGATKEGLERTRRDNAVGLRLHTIGVTSDLKVGIAKARQWTCLRCAFWIDLFRPQIYELFSGGFKTFGTPKEILSTAVHNHAAKKVGYWKRVSKEKPEDSEPDVYDWLKPRDLVQNGVRSVKLGARDAAVFQEAYALARGATYKTRPMTKVMNFGSVLVDPKTGEIAARGMTRGALSSERAAVEKAVKDRGAKAIRGFHLYTVGVDPDGWVAVAEDEDATCFGCARDARRLGLVYHELLPDGFRPVDPAATEKRLGRGRFSQRYWRTVDNADERVTSPFRYHWFAPPRRGVPAR